VLWLRVGAGFDISTVHVSGDVVAGDFAVAARGLALALVVEVGRALAVDLVGAAAGVATTLAVDVPVDGESATTCAAEAIAEEITAGGALVATCAEVLLVGWQPASVNPTPRSAKTVNRRMLMRPPVGWHEATRAGTGMQAPGAGGPTSTHGFASAWAPPELSCGSIED
jgi:hypothetical protein